MATLAVSYFFYIGLALCAIIAALCLRFFVKPYQPKSELIALLVALSFAIVAPIALTADFTSAGKSVAFLCLFSELVVDGVGLNFSYQFLC